MLLYQKYCCKFIKMSFFLLIFLTFLFESSNCAMSEGKTDPNIIFILTDDQDLLLGGMVGYYVILA